jgi:release factor glutamine methyltransferase
MQHGPNEVATIRNLLADAERSLAEGPHAERARRDAETLLIHVIRNDAPDVNLAWLIAHGYETLPARETSAFRAWVERRRAGEPIQYITGEAEFYGLSFRVNRAVLIPRPETEHLVERVIEIAGGLGKQRIADVGTGSGAIAVALACKLPAARILATEISAEALAVARGNAERNGVANRVAFHEGDLLAPVAGKLFDFVISNPDGLGVYRRLIPAAFKALFHDRYLVLEIGFGQQEAVGELLADARFEDIEFTKDLQGISRVAVGRRP